MRYDVLWRHTTRAAQATSLTRRRAAPERASGPLLWLALLVAAAIAWSAFVVALLTVRAAIADVEVALGGLLLVVGLVGTARLHART